MIISRLLFVLCLLAAGLARADDNNLLVNGDLSDGKSHWKGDGKDASSGDMTDINAPLDNPSSAKGMIIAIKKMGWTSVSQEFTTHENTLNFSMTYTTSSDFVPSNFDGYSINALGMLVQLPLQQTPMGPGMNNFAPQQRHPKSVIVVIADPDHNEVVYSFIPMPPVSDQPQTISTTINKVMENEEKTLYVAFWGGAGTLTFTNISLTASNPSSQGGSDNPFQNN